MSIKVENGITYYRKNTQTSNHTQNSPRSTIYRAPEIPSGKKALAGVGLLALGAIGILLGGNKVAKTAVTKLKKFLKTRLCAKI